MRSAFDTLLNTVVNAKTAAANSDNETFRYECLCCGEEVYLAAQDSAYKATHFRHKSGNNDKDCEFYLGQYGIVPSSTSSRIKRQERVEFYYQNIHKAFYMSFRFSDAEITAYEGADTCIEVRANRNHHPFFVQKINHTNFCEDSAELFMIDTYAFSYYISNTSNNLKREYSLFTNIGPTFFKITGEEADFSSNSVENNNFIAKNIKSKSLYTNIRYFIAWPGQNTAQIRLAKVLGVKIDGLMQFKTMNNITVWALVATFTEKNPKLDALLCEWGYDLSISEELTLLWPPAYENDETYHVSSKSIFVFSSFTLQPFGNTNTHSNEIHIIDTNTTKLDLKDKIRILKKNAEMSVVTTKYNPEFVTLAPKRTTAYKFKIPETGTFYLFSSYGVERLAIGQTVFLTETSSIIEYNGNYFSTEITLPEEKEKPLSQKIQDALSYYWVYTPYEKEPDGQHSEYALEYLQRSKNEGYINKAVLTLIEEEEK